MVKLGLSLPGLVVVTSIRLVAGEATGEATIARVRSQNTRNDTNRFLGHWSSHLTYSSGERLTTARSKLVKSILPGQIESAYCIRFAGDRLPATS